MTTETTNQAAWIAHDSALAKGATAHEAVRARAAVHMGPNIEGPAEHPANFSARSTARLFGAL